MARVALNWRCVDFAAEDVSGWRDFKGAAKAQIGEEGLELLLSSNAVYVIRVQRPLAFNYENGVSPVAYIGRGKAQQRITSHLDSWIREIEKRIPSVKISIWFCEPRAPRVGRNMVHVEADLIAKFIKKFGERPLRNRQIPTSVTKNIYAAADLQVLNCRPGPGYHWAIRPLKSSPFYRLS